MTPVTTLYTYIGIHIYINMYSNDDIIQYSYSNLGTDSTNMM